MHGYIKLWRRLLDDPLWTQVPTAWFRVALAILLRANWKPAKWWDGAQEIELPAGSLVTSRPSMCKLARVTSQQYRDALRYLTGATFLTSKTTKRYTIINVCNWARYQGEAANGNQEENQERTNKEPTGNPLGTTDEEGKNTRKQECKKGTGTDLDCAATNHKNRDSRPRVVSSPPSTCKQYPQVREFLALYMMEVEDLKSEKVYPTDRHVVDVMGAAGPGATEKDVCLCLKHLYEQRGLRPGTEHGPRTFAWFPTVVKEYFDKRAIADEVTNPRGSDHWTADGSEWVDGSFDPLDGEK